MNEVAERNEKPKEGGQLLVDNDVLTQLDLEKQGEAELIWNQRIIKHEETKAGNSQREGIKLFESDFPIAKEAKMTEEKAVGVGPTIEDQPSRWCISYDQLLEVDKEARQMFGTFRYKTKTMHDIVECIIMPKCKETGKSYARYLNPEGLPIESFVTHAWNGFFEHFVRSIVEIYKTRVKKPNLWICAFALFQSKDRASIQKQIGNSLEEAPFVRALKEASEYCVIRNSTIDIYSRIWCVCELMHASKLDLSPSVSGPNQFKDLHTSCVDAEASEEEDKKRILNAIVTEFEGAETIDIKIRLYRNYDSQYQPDQFDRAKISLMLCFGFAVMVAITVAVTFVVSSPAASIVTTSQPTNVPTSEASLSPTISEAPSSAPSMLPTGAPTADFCNISMNITSCSERESGIDCHIYQDLMAQDALAAANMADCLSDPIEIEMMYVGGSCDYGTPPEGHESLAKDCSEYNGGLPWNVSIVITSSTNPTLLYYEGVVSYSQTIKFSNPELSPIADILNISIYSNSEDSSPKTLLQRSVERLDCGAERGGSISWDIYGALAFMGFTSIEQGTKKLVYFFPITQFPMVFQTQISNEGVTPARITNLTINSMLDSYGEYYSDVYTYPLPNSGLRLDPGDGSTFGFVVTRSATFNETYTFLNLVDGVSETGISCFSASLESWSFDASFGSNTENTPLVYFVNGLEITKDGVDIASDPSGPCQIEATIECKGQTVHGNVDCGDVVDCAGPFITELQLTLTGGNCGSESTRQQPSRNTCINNFGGFSTVDQEALVTVHLQDTVLLRAVVKRSETITLQSKFGLGPFLDITILSADATLVLQEQRFWTCERTIPSLVGSQLGAFRVANFTSAIATRPLANIGLFLNLENRGAYNSSIAATFAYSSDGLGSIQLDDTKDIPINSQQNVSVAFLSERVDNWLSSYTVAFSWSASIHGTSENGRRCQSVVTATYSELLQPVWGT